MGSIDITTINRIAELATTTVGIATLTTLSISVLSYLTASLIFKIADK